jgi:hypothetical protein
LEKAVELFEIVEPVLGGDRLNAARSTGASTLRELSAERLAPPIRRGAG